MGSKGRRRMQSLVGAGIPNSHAGTGGLRARVVDGCSVLRIDRGRRSTGLYTAGRGLCSNVGAEMAAEASGGVAAAGGARTSGGARSETGRQGAQTSETERGPVDADADRRAVGQQGSRQRALDVAA